MHSSFREKLNFENRNIIEGATGIFYEGRFSQERITRSIPKTQTYMGVKRGQKWQSTKFDCRESKLTYSNCLYNILICIYNNHQHRFGRDIWVRKFDLDVFVLKSVHFVFKFVMDLKTWFASVEVNSR